MPASHYDATPTWYAHWSVLEGGGAATQKSCDPQERKGPWRIFKTRKQSVEPSFKIGEGSHFPCSYRRITSRSGQGH